MTGHGVAGAFYVTGEGKEFGCKIQLCKHKDTDLFDGLFDACLLWELEQLWSKGIKTECSCCGHSESYAKIAVSKESCAAIEALGYEKCEPISEGCFKVGGSGSCCCHWYAAKSRKMCMEGNTDV